MNKGKLITFEGLDGCGKTTQAVLLVNALLNAGYEVLTTRQPGGSMVGRALRKIALEWKGKLFDETELFLFMADRAQHVREVVKPALEAGKIVICDRYFDSSVAYQGHGRGMNINMIERLNGVAADGCWPDLTFLIDMPVEAARARRAGSTERMEAMDIAFHERVRGGFLDIFERAPGRVQLISGTRSVEAMHEQILATAFPLLTEGATRETNTPAA